MQITTTLFAPIVGVAVAGGMIYLQHERTRYLPVTLVVAFAAAGGAWVGWTWAAGVLATWPPRGIDRLLVRAVWSIITQSADLLALATAGGAVIGAGCGKILMIIVPPPAKKTERGAVIGAGDGGEVGKADGVMLAGVRLPESLESRGFQFCGAPGTGKTQAILGLLTQARRRGDRVIIADPAGDILARLHRDTDVILAPGDARSVSWSPFADLRDASECDTLAASLIPPGHGGGAEWHGYARTLVSALLKSLSERGDATTGALVQAALHADKDDLGALLASTPAARLVGGGADKMLASVLGIIGTHLSALTLLDARASQDAFSLRDWIDGGEGWLWLPYRDSAAESSRSLRRAWLDIVVRAVLDSDPDRARRTWIVLDELPAHGQLTALAGAAARGRKYGLRLVLGYQTAAQLREVYGRDGAESVLGCTGHTLILRTPDPETSDRLSRQIGEIERERAQVSRSRSAQSARHGHGTSTSTTTVSEIRRAVLPAEIQGLPDLRGYLLLAGDTVAARRVTVPIIKLSRRVPAHVAAATAPPAATLPPPAAVPAADTAAAPPPDDADDAVDAVEVADGDADDDATIDAFDAADGADFDPDS
ncbi:MAG: type IV secretion system DNA-binding domain-containing protein [Gammaproteobacteria bacterium]|nr:type IV secretion system DNA-binding domain-containing protein [Gammaproteobacteria bacterium]